jgi:hypothetical protein
MEGEIKGYRIGSYARHRTLWVDLDEIDEKLMQPIGPYWNDPSVEPRKRATNNNPVPDRSAAVRRIDPLDKTYYRFCNCGHRAIGDHTPDSVGPCHAPTWVKIPGELSRDTGPCKCREFDEDIQRRRRKPRKYHG